MKTKFHKFLNDSPLGGVLLTLLIVGSLVAFALETEFVDSRKLAVINFVIAMLFMAEYFARIWTADVGQEDQKKARLGYIFSFYGVIDLIAFLPALLLPAANGSVMLRMLRLLRLVQIMKIKAVSRGVKQVAGALKESRSELIISVTVSVVLIFIGAVLMYLVEGRAQPDAFGSVPRSLWWAMATLTTVGYGDVYPITPLGRVLASFMALVGVAAVAMPAGILAAAFTRQDVEKD